MPRDAREIRPDQLRAALAACAEPLRALGWNVPVDLDLSDQASGARIDHLRRLTGMAGVEIIKSKSRGRGPRAADLDIDAADLPEGLVRPERVRELRPITSREAHELQSLEAAARDAGMEGGSL